MRLARPLLAAIIAVGWFVPFTLQGQEASQVNMASVDISGDSLLQTYSVDELLEFQEYYQERTDQLLLEKKKLRQKGIRDMEAFLRSHPNSPILDKIIIRLAELHYEQAAHDYEAANEEYSRLLELYDQGAIQELPAEPVKDYRRALTLYQQIIDEFPESSLRDDAIYNKGVLLEELGRWEEAQAAYHQLIESSPESRYLADTYMRLGEYYFNPPVNDIEKAIEFYKKVLEYKESTRYDAALYRLGWAYYKLSDYPSAIAYFTILADDIERAKKIDPQYRYHFPAVRDEAVEYIGISFLDYGGPDLAARYFDQIGGRGYGREVLMKIGDSYLEVKEEYQNAIRAYQLLLTMYPDAPEAPQIQAKIAEAYRNLEDERMAYVRRAELFRNYSPGSEWWEKTADVEAKEKANALAERALRDNINLLLRRAEQTGDESLFFQAVSDSREYLRAFPDDENAPSMHWNMALMLDEKLGMREEAFEEYIKISNRYWNTKFQKPAAENAIAIADEAVRADTLGRPEFLPLTIGEIRENLAAQDSLRKALNLEERPLTEDEERLAFALDNYIKLFPHEPETANILAKGGALYYERHHFRQSLKYFKTLVKHFPDSPEVDYARYIIMESYFGRGDYQSTELIASRLRDVSPEYAEKANRRLAESIFLQAKTYADSMQHLKAAEEYRRVVQHAPRVEIADLALYNSALEYENAKEYRRAVEGYNDLINNYPDSEHYLNAVNNLAFDYRELEDFKNAALTYEKLADLHPDPEKAEAALYNASLSYVQAEEWRHAIDVNNEFVERFPDSEDADNLLFDNAHYYLKLNDIESANRIYEEFATKFPKSPRVVEAYYRRGEYFRSRGLMDDAIAEYDRALQKSDELSGEGLDANEYFAAEALFAKTEIKFEEFDAIDFKLPAETLARNKERKKALLRELVEGYKEVAAYGTLRLYEATYKIGLAYEEFATTWSEQDIPEADENRRIVAEKEVNETAADLYEKAFEAYKHGVELLTRLAEKHAQTTEPDTASSTERVVLEDSTVLVADRWISRCKEKISKSLYEIAELSFESVNRLLEAPPPAGISRTEELVYRNQLLTKAVSPLIEEIVAAHRRNLEEARALDLDNQWTDLSRDKIITIGNIMPSQFSALAMEALSEYGRLMEHYVGLVESGDPSALDISDQMYNILEFGKSYALAAAKGFRSTIEEARELGIDSPALANTEERLMKFVLDYHALTSDFAEQAEKHKTSYQTLLQETERLAFEDAVFTFEENYAYLAQASQEVLTFGYESSQALGMDNQYVYEIIMALIRVNPEENAPMFGLEVAEQTIPTSQAWLASRHLYVDWTAMNFDDSAWMRAHVESVETKFGMGEVKRIWMRPSAAAYDSAALAEEEIDTEVLSAMTGRPDRLYFRRSLDVDGLVVSGRLQILADDSYKLYVNNKLIARVEHREGEEVGLHVHDLSPHLVGGKNVLAVEVWDANKSGGGFEGLLRIKHIPGWEAFKERLRTSRQPDGETPRSDEAETNGNADPDQQEQ